MQISQTVFELLIGHRLLRLTITPQALRKTEQTQYVLPLRGTGGHNNAGRIITGTRQNQHITPALKKLHGLPTAQCIK